MHSMVAAGAARAEVVLLHNNSCWLGWVLACSFFSSDFCFDLTPCQLVAESREMKVLFGITHFAHTWTRLELTFISDGNPDRSIHR